MVTVGTPAGWERREGAVDDVEPAVGKIISYHNILYGIGGTNNSDSGCDIVGVNELEGH